MSNLWPFNSQDLIQKQQFSCLAQTNFLVSMSWEFGTTSQENMIVGKFVHTQPFLLDNV